MAIGTTAVGLALNVSNLGMVPALIQRNDAKLTHYNTAWTVGVLRALLVTGGIAFSAPWIAAAFGEPGAENIIRALALRPLFEALASIQVARLTRDLRFRALAGIRVPPAIIDLFLASLLAKSLGVWAMVVGSLSGSLAVIFLSYWVAPHRPRPGIDREAAGSLIRFGRWIFVSGLLAVAGGALINLVISRSLGVAALGLFVLAGKLAFLPYQVASDVVGSVAFPLYSKLQENREAVAEAFRGFLVGMACLLLPVYAVIVGLAPDVVEHVLGPRWQGTGPIIQVLAFVGALGLLGDAVEPLLKGLGYPRKIVAVGVVQTALIICCVQVFSSHWGVVGAALAWIPAKGASQVLSGFYVSQLVPRPFSRTARPMLAVLFSSLVAFSLAVGLVRGLPGAPGAILAGLCSGLVAFLVLWWLDRRFSLGFAEAIPIVLPRVGAWFE